MKGRVVRTFAALLASSACLPVGTAHAYNYASPFADGCHERLTVEALSAVREETKLARALSTSRRDRAWIEDLPLELPREAHDLGAATLVAGVRDNDLKGAGSLEADQLAQVHGNPRGQREHCLRRPEDDEPTGTQRAVEDCRGYILERFDIAVRSGFDGDGHVDPNARTQLEITLDFAGQATVPMPTAYLELGHALHALQDSFAHAIRSEDGLRVRSLLNWVDYVGGHIDPARDGPIHRAALDECTALDAVRRTRLRRASEASRALLLAAFQAGRSPDEKTTEARAVLDRYLSFEDGCDVRNDYCDAPELRYAVSSMDCGVAGIGARSSSAGVWWVIALVLMLLVLHTRRRVSRVWVVSAGLALASANGAAAQGTRANDVAGDIAARVSRSPIAARGALSASVDEPGAALAAGARYELTPRWLVGLDAEWNPWTSLQTWRIRSGVLNVFASGTWRSPVSNALALRVTARAGVSALLFDMYGAPSGSVGPYLGLSLLALEVVLASNTALVLEPADVVVTVPHVTGIPYIRRQYRATVAIEVRL